MEVLKRKQYCEMLVFGALFISNVCLAQETAQMPPHTQKPAAVIPHSGEEKQKPGIVRTYYIAADEVDWDYTPRGRNLAGLPHVETAEDETGGTAKHRIYHKAVYHEYIDATFTTVKIRPQQWEHLGILGPLIRAEVGDSIRVIF